MTPTRQASGAHRTNKWYAFDATNERLSLFSLAGIAGFGLAVALGLYLVFPQKGLEEQLGRVSRSDPLTVEYLKAFLAARPDSPRLRLLLARQLMQLGRYDEVREVLSAFAGSPMDAAHIEAELHEFDLREREAFAFPEGSPQRTAAQGKVAQQLRRLASFALSGPQLDYLARRAVAAGDRDTAVAMYGRIVEAGDMRSAQGNAEVAERVLGLGGYGVAAQFYFRAVERSVQPSRKREYYMAAVRTLMAGNLYDAAIEEADRHLGALGDDPDTLKFLVRTAQAANRADAAQRYVKRLLRMALEERMRAWMAGGGIWLAGPDGRRADIGGAAALSGGGIVRVNLEVRGPSAPFDDETYLLGFNVFLAAGNLADAYRVAESAVLQAPQAADWRKRFAQVAEWRGVPRVGLAQWLSHARMTGDESSWDAVWRLAKALFDDGALLAVLTHRLDLDPGRAELLEEIIAVHERLGDPGAALAFIEARARGPQRQRNLERLAQLAERAGRDRLAFETWRTLAAEYGPSLNYATRVAGYHYLAGDLRAAFAALDAVAGHAASGETAFWQMYAELARLLDMDEKAIAGYQRLLVSEKYVEGDLQNLIALLDAMRPDQAARVAEFAWAKFRRADLALQVLYQHARGADHAAVGRFLARLDADDLARLEADTRFLAARASHFQNTGDLRRALADLRASDMLDPANPDTQAGMLWTMIALRDTQPLRHALARLAPVAEREARLWGPFAAALMALNRQADALRWFRKQADQKGDYLWLMAFAECLDANAQPEVAWRVRRKVWMDLRRPDVLATIPADQFTAMRDRLASVAQVFVAGDGAKRMMEQLLRADLEELRKPAQATPLPATGAELVAALEQGAAAAMPQARRVAGPLPEAWFRRSDAAPEPRFPAADNDATVKELALAWAQNGEAHELGRAWLLTRFAGNLAKPLWGELSVALAGGDRETLTRLIDDLPDWLPMYDRVEAALRIGRPALAQTLAFEQLDHLQADEELHARFTTMAVEDPARLGLAATGIRQSPLAIAQTRAEAGADITPRLKMGFTLSVNRQSTQDETALVNVPQTDTSAALFLRYRGERGPVTLTVGHRSAMREFDTMKLDYDLAVAPRLRLAGSIGVQQTASELALLRVGGTKDMIDHTLSWAFGNREYARAGVSLNRFHTQDGTYLGRGAIYNVEVGHRIRLEYPDFNLRWTLTRANLASSGRSDALIRSLQPADVLAGAPAFLPSSYTQYGFSFGWGQYLQERYTRALRPYFDIGLFHNSVTGNGRSARLGVAGSLAGQDHAAAYIGQSTGTPGAPQGLREFGLTYQWFY